MLSFVGELDLGERMGLREQALEEWLERAVQKEAELDVFIGKFVRNEPQANLEGEVLRPKNQDMLKAYTLLKEAMLRAKIKLDALKRAELDRDMRAYKAGMGNSNEDGTGLRF